MPLDTVKTEDLNAAIEQTRHVFESNPGASDVLEYLKAVLGTPTPSAAERLAAIRQALSGDIEQLMTTVQLKVLEAFTLPASLVRRQEQATVLSRLVVEIDTSQIDAALTKVAELKAACAAPTAAPEPAAGDRVDGGIYLGTVENAAGVRERVILLDGEAQDVSWNEAMKWAELQGGALPTRAEQRLLFEKLQNQFQPRWYWSCEQHADYSDYAWNQNFGNGDQYGSRKSYAGRARAVRRLPIQ